MAHNHQDAQEIITHFSKSVMAFGTKMNKVMYQPPLGPHDMSQDIQIEDQVLTQFNKFKYQCFRVINNNKWDAELDIRISDAYKALSKQAKEVGLAQ